MVTTRNQLSKRAPDRASTRVMAPRKKTAAPPIQAPRVPTPARKAMLGEQLLMTKQQQKSTLRSLKQLKGFLEEEEGKDFGTDYKPAEELDHLRDLREMMVNLHSQHPRVRRIYGSAQALTLADRNFQVSKMQKLDPVKWKKRGKRALLPGSPQMQYHGDGDKGARPLLTAGSIFYDCVDSVIDDCGGDLLISLQLTGDVRRRGKKDRKEHPRKREIGSYHPSHATTYFFAGDTTHAVMPVVQERLSRYAIIQFYELPEFMVDDEGKQIETMTFLERERGRCLRGWTLFCSQCSHGFQVWTSLTRHYRAEHPRAPRGNGCESVEFKGFSEMPFLHTAPAE
jgi:hypothetical protein